MVQDNGIGIDPAYQQNIFEVFHQLNTQESEGEGLGWNIIQQLLGNREGKIRVESENGTGSCFYVTLPSG